MSPALLSRIRRLSAHAKAAWCNRSVRYLLLGGALSTAAIAIGTVIMVANFRDRAWADSERELKNTALILAGQIDRSFKSLELVQVRIVEKLQSFGVASSEDYARHIASKDGHLMMKASISGMPHIAAITLIDADGNLMGSSRDGPIPTANLADRDYFHALKSDAQLTSFLLGSDTAGSPKTGLSGSIGTLLGGSMAIWWSSMAKTVEWGLTASSMTL